MMIYSGKWIEVKKNQTSGIQESPLLLSYRQCTWQDVTFQLGHVVRQMLLDHPDQRIPSDAFDIKTFRFRGRHFDASPEAIQKLKARLGKNLLSFLFLIAMPLASGSFLFPEPSLAFLSLGSPKLTAKLWRSVMLRRLCQGVNP